MMTTEQAAKRLGLFRPTVTDLVAKGAIKATKFGVSWIIDESSVMEFAKKNGLVKELSTELDGGK